MCHEKSQLKYFLGAVRMAARHTKSLMLGRHKKLLMLGVFSNFQVLEVLPTDLDLFLGLVWQSFHDLSVFMALCSSSRRFLRASALDKNRSPIIGRAHVLQRKEGRCQGHYSIWKVAAAEVEGDGCREEDEDEEQEQEQEQEGRRGGGREEGRGGGAGQTSPEITWLHPERGRARAAVDGRCAAAC